MIAAAENGLRVDVTQVNMTFEYYFTYYILYYILIYLYKVKVVWNSFIITLIFPISGEDSDKVSTL